MADDENIADTLADDDVVAIATVPLTAAIVPDAVTEPLKDANPEPPATASSSSSVSSTKISILFLSPVKHMLLVAKDDQTAKLLPPGTSQTYATYNALRLQRASWQTTDTTLNQWHYFCVVCLKIWV